MENHLKDFWNSVEKEEGMLLSTSAGDRVTMRTVSPVAHDGSVLIFTHPKSLKYMQLKENPNCCFAVGGCFVEAVAEFKGSTMLDVNSQLRDVYAGKFTGAFDENVEFGGRGSEFIVLKPMRIKGWSFEKGMPTGSFEYEF